MPKICYVAKNFHGSTLELIDTANAIIDDYQVQGFSLTLRQLYYQLVSRDIIENSDKSYKRLGSNMGDARLAGLVDWNAIEDRTRNLAGNQHWTDPSQIIRAARASYMLNRWENQPYHVECWVEKEALADVVRQACSPLDVSYFSCRGYGSLSEMWRAGQRLAWKIKDGKRVVIIHLGDHDPSGIDMTRDIADRLSMFTDEPVDVERIALNMDQINQYNPPPNPAKITDSRANEYIKTYGRSSWELDALEPRILVELIQDEILSWRDEDLWQEILDKEKEGKDLLVKTEKRWIEVAEFLGGNQVQALESKE